MASITDNIANTRRRLCRAAEQSGRKPEEITLLAVSKTQPAEAIAVAHAAGQIHFGENYLQEALNKQEALSDLPLVWHFIGPIQSNKTRAIAEHFDWVHSVDRLKIAERLAAQRPSGSAPLNVCLQVNISGEQSKAGVAADGLAALAAAVHALPQLRLRGLMAIPEPSEDPLRQRAVFAEVAELQRRLSASLPALDTLSMGMSGDMEAAVAEGATIVRIGTDIFGARS
jgi:pyridoxal phosphate enzyme (YggS family)